MRSPIPPPGTEANRLLASLPPDVHQRIVERCEAVPLAHKTTVSLPDAPIDYAYFPRAGCISVVSVMADGSNVEVGTIGWEGVCGISLLHGVASVPTMAMVQIPGSALRMPANEFTNALRDEESFRTVLSRYAQVWANVIGRGGSCNAVHSVEERCARWLLMTHDRLEGDLIPLTQEFLGIMLGVRRASVTLAAASLQQAGLINYKHGKIVVLDREGLEGAACECYEAIRRNYDRLPSPATALREASAAD
jgi:CRP-like cAMP-binding protein